MKKTQKQKATARVSFRLWPEQERAVRAALAVAPNGWRGAAYFAREALLNWAYMVPGSGPAHRKLVEDGRRKRKAA